MHFTVYSLITHNVAFFPYAEALPFSFRILALDISGPCPRTNLLFSRQLLCHFWTNSNFRQHLTCKFHRWSASYSECIIASICTWKDFKVKVKVYLLKVYNKRIRTVYSDNVPYLDVVAEAAWWVSFVSCPCSACSGTRREWLVN